MLRAGEVSSRELVGVYLDRIERIDPDLNSFREVFAEEALEAAGRADERIASGETAPMLGVPIAFKDELDIAGRVTNHGTNAYDTTATTNAVHVQRMLDAGAIALGKTNLPELAAFGFTESAATGDTRNPWDPSRTPGGSSGGSAAAVAAGLVGAASASDGAGSIRIPAAFCGLFGLMPQRGRISLMPEHEHWYGMSRTGCLTRRVLDTALWLDVAAGPEPGDSHRAEVFAGSYVEAARSSPTTLRIATSVTPPGSFLPPTVDAVVVDAVAKASAVLAGLGHAVVETTPDYGSVGNEIPVVYTAGITAHHDEVPHPERLERRIRSIARYGHIIPDRMLRSALRRQADHSARINRIFDQVDILVTPVTGVLPPEVGRWRGKGGLRTALSQGRIFPFTPVWNYTGQPAAAVPVGFSAEGLPLSVMLIAPPEREDLLLSLAFQLENALDWTARRPAL